LAASQNALNQPVSQASLSSQTLKTGYLTKEGNSFKVIFASNNTTL